MDITVTVSNTIYTHLGSQSALVMVSCASVHMCIHAIWIAPSGMLDLSTRIPLQYIHAYQPCMCTFYFHVHNKRHSLYFILQAKPKKIKFRGSKVPDFSAIKTILLFFDVINSLIPAVFAAIGWHLKIAAITAFVTTGLLYFFLAVVFAFLRLLSYNAEVAAAAKTQAAIDRISADGTSTSGSGTDGISGSGTDGASGSGTAGTCGSGTDGTSGSGVCIKMLLISLEIAGGLFYFVGDNLPPFFEDFKPDHDNMIVCAQGAAKVLLGAGILLLFGPSLLLKQYEKKRDSRGDKEASPSQKSARNIFFKVWFSLKLPLSQIPKLDAVFTAIVRIGNGCDTKKYWIADFVLFGIFCFVSLALFIFLHSCEEFSTCTTKTDKANGTEGGIRAETKKSKSKNECPRHCSCFHLMCNIGLAGCLGLYLLGDNKLPLDCVMDEHARNILQIVFLFVTLVVVTLVMIGVIVEECQDSCCDCCRKRCCSCCCPDVVVSKEMKAVTDLEVPLLLTQT